MGGVLATLQPLGYQVINLIWPDLANQKANIAPPRNGMDRATGKIISGWPHVQQSLDVLFVTPFHQRVLRRWVGSFVPHILGQNIVAKTITRFFWAIASAIDLWEPGYRVDRVYFMGDALNSWAPISPVTARGIIRLGQVIMRTEGTYFPRGHLGDFTPASTQK